MVQKPVWNHAMMVNHHKSAMMTHPHSKKHVVPTTVLTRSKLVPLNVVIPITTAVPQTNVKHQRPAKHVVNKPYLPIRRPINHRPIPKNSNFHQKVTTVKPKRVNAVQGTKGNWGNPQQALKDKGVIDSGCSRHMTENISYLSDFKEINEGYVAFGRNLKGDTECIVLSSDFKLPNENHVLLRVPRENNMYNIDLKNIVPLRDLTCLFAKATLDESNLWHRRLGHINFKTMNKLVKGNLVRGLPSKVFENNHTFVACKKGKQHRASWNRPTWLFDIDTLTQSMNYQPVVAGNQSNRNAGIQGNFHADLSTRVRDLSDEFKEFFVNTTNRVNAASAPVSTVGPSSANNTNSFNVAGPSDNVVSPNFEIDDEDDVGAEADFSNMETSITEHTQEEGIDYEEVCAPVARIEAIRLFLAYASFMGFMVYQMDVKSTFLYGTIEKEVYVCQPPGFRDLDYLIRRSYFPPANTVPRHSRRKNTSIVESEIQTNATMADNHTMAQMLQAPNEGYEDAIVVPPINANNFELKQTFINLIAASLEDKLDIRMNRFKKSVNEMKNSFITPTAPLKQLRKYALPADQTIAIISVHSLEEEMIFQNSTITSNNFRPQQSEISFKTVKMFLTRCVRRDFISLLIKTTTKIVFKAIISIKTVHQTKELSIRTVHRKTLIFKNHYNKTRLCKANSKPTPQRMMLI
nr:ribonuclease H-like domain-containing protein [Tanacetum cinerariifolium]